MILVVDDDQNIVRALRRRLRKSGYEVVSAGDGLEAYSHIKSPRCKCMLLDINMPRINGAELLLLMQAEGINVPTIVMAGFVDFDEDEMKQFSNVVKYLPKPFEMREMVSAVEECAAA